ncbi:MAG: aldehyde dehydrogenase family protein [Brumimicrobium sp.]|nr:aldehyde dehydrogenase family protein [Brumimicrobium sp.]
MKIYNPYNKKEVGEIYLSSQKEADAIVANAVKAQPICANLTSGERAEILKDIVDGITVHFDDFVNTIVKESGKPYKYAKGEVLRAIQTFTIASEESKRLPHELFDLDATAKGKGLKGEYVYFPKGVVLGISPFNFPLNLVAHKVAPAIATGCPIILKPSEKTPLTAELLAKIIAKTKLSQGAFQVLHCKNEVTQTLVQNKDIQLVSFTGSAKVGWDIKAAAGRKQVVLELGGNAAAIVHQDAELDLAIEELLVGGFAYSGQVCIHTQRIYVHASLFDSFTQKYIQKVQALNIGDPKNETTEFGVLINEDNAIRIESWVNEAIQAGAKSLLEGKREGAFYPPTILTHVAKGQKVRDEEVFGPVVVIEKYSQIDEAITQVNDSDWGLQAAIFTNSISIRDKTFNELKVGAVIHNKSTTFRVDDMPYGGIKASGFGREGVRYAMMDYLEGKLLVR